MNVELITTTHRIQAHDDGPRRACGLTLSVALDSTLPTAAGADPAAGLWPWTWKPIEEVVVFTGPWKKEPPGSGATRNGIQGAAQGNDNGAESAERKPIWRPLAAVRPTDTPRSGRNELDGRFDALVDRLRTIQTKRSWSFGWTGPRVPLAGGAEQHPWPAFVAELSQLPWPFAQALNLSLGFDLPELAAEAVGSQFIAAPIVCLEVAADPLRAIRWVPIAAGTDPTTPEDATRLRVAYECFGAAVTELPFDGLEAVAKTEALDGPSDGELMRFSDQWVVDRNPVDQLEPWLDRLESRWDRFADLVPFLLAAPSRSGAPGGLLADAEPGTVRTVGIALLRDLVGLGAFPESYGPAAKWTPDQRKKAYEELADLTLEEWIASVLVPALTSTAGPDTETSGGAAEGLGVLRKTTTPQDPARLIPQLLALHERLQRPEVVAAVYLGQLRHLARRWPVDVPTKRELPKDLARVLRREVGERTRQRFLLALGPEGDRLEPSAALLGAVKAEIVDRLAESPAGLPDSPRLAQRPLATPVGFEPSSEEVAGFVRSILPALAGQQAGPSTPRVEQQVHAEGITLRVDRLGTRPDPAVGGEDLQTRLRGVGLLGRRVGQTGWRHLHVAAACPAGSGTAQVPVLRPSKIVESRDLRQATITFDGEPVTVLGPLALLHETLGYRLEPANPAANRGVPEALAFSYWPGPVEGAVPALAFGVEYEFAAYLVSNCGALPRALVSPSGPTCAPRWPEAAGGLEAEVPKDAIQRVAYRRRCRVGSVRLAARADGSARELELPAVPRGVVPRLNELREIVAAGESPEPPLLFLTSTAGAADRFTFQIRPPGTHIEIWDRWVAFDSRTASLRSRIRQEWAEIVSGQTGIGRKPDVSFDDPAVSSSAELWVAGLDFANGRPDGRKDRKMLVWTERDGAGSLARVQRTGIEIAIVATDELEAGRPVISTRSGRVEVLVPPGLYHLGVDLEIPHWERFEEGFAEARMTQALFLLEVPDLKPWNRKAAETQLYAALSGGEEEGRIRFQLELDPQRHASLWRHAVRAEILRQSWSWQGRPLPPGQHPALQHGAGREPNDEELRLWEVHEMGWRSDSQFLSHPMQPAAGSDQNGEPDAGASPRRFSFSEPLVVAGAEDVRAMHHRFAVRVEHRYAPLLEDDDRSVRSADPGLGSPWRRFFVPCRWHREVPVPNVRFVLPLTDRFELDEANSDMQRASADSGGLLVLVDEPWFEVGGLAEMLSAEVVTVPGPEEPGDLACLGEDVELDGHYYEFGPDPLVTGSAWPPGALKGPDPANRSGETEPIRFDGRIFGPVGHTFDRVSEGAHYRAASFVIRPPTGEGFPEGASGRDWAMVRLRFRRELIVGESRLRSQPSAPFWAQFLPPIRVLASESLAPGTPARGELVSRGGGPLRFWLVDAEGRAVGPADRQGRPFLPLLLLTREVPDVTSGLLQEAYVDVCLPPENGGGGWRPVDLKSVEGLAGSVLRLRVLELQGPAPALAAVLSERVPVWKSLFGQPASGDVPADRLRTRITRVSQPLGDIDIAVPGKESP